jgi:hypothetical protein
VSTEVPTAPPEAAATAQAEAGLPVAETTEPVIAEATVGGRTDQVNLSH